MALKNTNFPIKMSFYTLIESPLGKRCEILAEEEICHTMEWEENEKRKH